MRFFAGIHDRALGRVARDDARRRHADINRLAEDGEQHDGALGAALALEDPLETVEWARKDPDARTRHENAGGSRRCNPVSGWARDCKFRMTSSGTRA